MKDQANKPKSTNTTLAVVGFAFGVLTVVLVAFALRGC
jgi:hypothetical protein